MKYIILIILFCSLTSCRNDELDAAKQNIFDPANQSSFLVYKLAADIYGANSSGFNSGSSNQPSNIFGYSDRIIVTSDSYSSTAPTFWVSTNGSDFTKYSVKIGDCVGVQSTSSSSTSTGCKAALVGYDNGSYMIFGQKFTNSTGPQTTDAQYYGTGTDLNTITLATTNTGTYTVNSYDAKFLYASGKLYTTANTNGGSAVLITSDGVTWNTFASQYCSSLYLADNGNSGCGLVKTFNGTSWVNAGTITGGLSFNSWNYSAVYMDNAYRAWNNNNGTLSIYKSTSGTLTGGITFPANAEGTVSMNGITNGSPSKLVKTSTGVYLLLAGNYINNVFTYSAIRSTDGTNWSTITPIFPSDLGTLAGMNGYTALGDKFYAVMGLKAANATYYSFYLLRSTDGITWTKVTLP
ncbi:MAG: hypothetical protein KBF99_06195 [Leptospiraceae bacterium]|nr:hypothetical protein [Leptospiraceae bacterium]